MININLLPPQQKLGRRTAKVNAAVFVFCFAIMIIYLILLVVLFSIKTTLNINQRISEKGSQDITQEINSYKDVEDQAILINDRANDYNQIQSKKIFWSEILDELAKCTPDEVVISNFNASEKAKPKITISGLSDNIRNAIKFKDKLEASEMFKNAVFDSSKEASQKDQSEKYNFTLKCDIESNQKTTKTNNNTKK
jgi:Tfp pilus assembly protein PilN